MPRVTPSQVVETIDDLFTHAKMGIAYVLQPGHSSQLLAILNLVKEIPSHLIVVDPADYANLVLATSTIESHLALWTSRGTVGAMGHVKGADAITVIRRVMVKCPDERPPSATAELAFISDEALRESIRLDIGASSIALSNSEWKAATVLAGAAIEALLLWRLKEPNPGLLAVQNAAQALAAGGSHRSPPADIDRWDLHQYIAVAANLSLIKPNTEKAAELAREFRNFIHPGRALRLNRVCDRATSYSAIAALEHVIRDLA